MSCFLNYFIFILNIFILCVPYEAHKIFSHSCEHRVHTVCYNKFPFHLMVNYFFAYSTLSSDLMKLCGEARPKSKVRKIENIR